MDNLLWQHLKTLPAFRALLRAVEARFYHQFEIPGPVLDLGCGDGDFTDHTFNEFGQHIDVGLDPWIGPLTKSVQRKIYKDGAMQALGDAMPFPSNHFGAVISNSVLEHIPDVTSVLVEAGRVLQPDGIFLMTMPNHRFTKMMWGALFFERLGLDKMADRYRDLFNFVSRHQHTEPIEWWADRLAQGGMVVERWQYYFSPAALHTLEFGHVQGLPAAVTHLFTGKWIIAPTRESLALTERWVRPYYLEQADADGCYQFIVARKVSDGPIVPPPLPKAEPFEVDPHGNLIPSETVPTSISPVKVTPVPMPLNATETGAITAEDFDTASSLPDEPDSFFRAITPSIHATFGVLSAILLAMIGVFLSDGRGTDRPWLAIFMWLCGIGSALYGLGYSTPNLSQIPGRIRRKLTLQNCTIPLVLFALAWGIRAWNLTGHPWIISGTEAAFGLERAVISAGIQTNPFGTDGLTNPLLPLFFTTFAENLFGPSVFALRVLSPIVGAATVALTYLVGRRFWGQMAGLAAAILLIGSHTHIHYSRIGLTNIWDPFFMLASGALLLIAWQKKGRLAWLATGLVAGISFYFFTAGHLLPAILPLLVCTLAATDEIRAIWHKSTEETIGFSQIRSMLAGVALSFIVMLPLLTTYLRHPGRFSERLARQGVIQSNWIILQIANTGASRRQVWLGQILESLSFFSPFPATDLSTYYGNWLGLLSPVPTVLFILGFVLALWQLKKHANQLVLWVMIITVFGAGILMSYPVQSHRYLVLIPFLSILGGMGVQQLAIWARRLLKIENDNLVILWIVLLAAGSVTADVRNYFGAWQQEHSFTDKNSEIAFEIAQALSELPAESVVYLQTGPDLNSSFPTIGYLANEFFIGKNIVDLPSLNGTVPELNSQGATVFVVLPDRPQEIELLRESFSDGREEVVSGYFADPLFTIFTVE